MRILVFVLIVCSMGCKGDANPTRRTTLYFAPRNEFKAVYIDELYIDSLKWKGFTIHIGSQVTKGGGGQNVFGYTFELDKDSKEGCLFQWDLIDLVSGPTIFELRPGEKYYVRHESFDSPVGVDGDIRAFIKKGEFAWEDRDITVNRFSLDRGWIDAGSWSSRPLKTFGPVPKSKLTKKRK